MCQVPHREDDLFILKEIEFSPAFRGVAGIEEIASEPIWNDRDRRRDVKFFYACQVALTNGDDMISTVERIFDHPPPLVALERKGVNITPMARDHEGNVVLLLEVGTSVAREPGKVSMNEIKVEVVLFDGPFYHPKLVINQDLVRPGARENTPGIINLHVIIDIIFTKSVFFEAPKRAE